MFSARPYSYPTDCTEEEWAFVAPYLPLLPLDAPQRRHDLRAVFDALRWLMRAGAPWRLLPGDLPPWHAVYDQAQRWMRAGVFEAMVHDLRVVLCAVAVRVAAGDRGGRTHAPEHAGARAGQDGA